MFRYSKTLIISDFIPDKKDNVALTFHNISLDQLDWFKETIDYLLKKYEFINPNNLEKEIKSK